jgi:uncharacterized phage-associated protein
MVTFEYDFDSTFAAITYLSSLNIPDLTKYKLCKLLFLADKNHLVRFGRTITGDKYCALPHGPIPSHTLNLLTAMICGEGHGVLGIQVQKLQEVLELDRQYENPHFCLKGSVNRDHLSDVTALDEVVREYGNLGFDQLKAITHAMFEYKNAWDGRPDGSKRAEMTFESFFEDDPHARTGARELMIEDNLLRGAYVGA